MEDDIIAFCSHGAAAADAASGQNAGVEGGTARILDPLIKRARRVGVRPISARTAPSK